MTTDGSKTWSLFFVFLSIDVVHVKKHQQTVCPNKKTEIWGKPEHPEKNPLGIIAHVKHAWRSEVDIEGIGT